MLFRATDCDTQLPEPGILVYADDPGPPMEPQQPKRRHSNRITELEWADELARREARQRYFRPIKDRVRKRPADHRLKLRRFNRLLDANPRDARAERSP